MKEPLSSRQVIETGVLFSLLAVLAGIFLDNPNFFIAASGMLAIVLVFPVVFKPLAIVWFGLSRWLGWVMSRLLLIIIFYLLVVPVGLVRKVLGADILKTRAFKRSSQSFWVNRDHRFVSDDLMRPF